MTSVERATLVAALVALGEQDCDAAAVLVCEVLDGPPLPMVEMVSDPQTWEKGLDADV